MNENKESYKTEKRILLLKAVVLYVAFIICAILLTLGFIAILKCCNDKESLTSFSVCVSILINTLIFMPHIVNVFDKHEDIRDEEKRLKSKGNEKGEM